jgi:hypothetical protein
MNGRMTNPMVQRQHCSAINYSATRNEAGGHYLCSSVQSELQKKSFKNPTRTPHLSALSADSAVKKFCFSFPRRRMGLKPNGVQEFITIQNLPYRILVFKVPCDPG